MSFNGSGLFQVNSAGQPVVTNTVITSTAFNALTADLANGLSSCILKDGTQVVTANIPMAGYNVTGIGVAATLGDALSYGRAASVTTLNASSTITATGTITGTQIVSNTSGFVATGFGNTMTLDVDGSIESDSGNGIRMICVSAGVVLSNGASSWAAISDYRAKNVSGEFKASGVIIDAIPVHIAALKSSPETTKAMFLAHEVQAQIPYAVHGEKDGDKMQVLESTDPLVPILWAEVRELRARLAALEARP